MPPRVAVLIPCYDEAMTIAQVIGDMRRALPDATIFVFDNNSRDATAEIARAAGAEVRTVRLQGKGNVVRRQFADVDADVYLMVDGDGTYDASAAPDLVAKVLEGHDMVVGLREASGRAAYRAGHAWGNRMLTGFLSRLFGRNCRDILSGYRAFSRRFVKSFPAQSTGFEIETELTVHALELRMPVAEVATIYGERPIGSTSKLNTWRDGFRILGVMLRLYAAERPVHFYTMLSIAFGIGSAVLFAPVLTTYFATGLVPRFPSLIVAAALLVVAVLAALAGVIVDAIARARREVKTLSYLRFPAPGGAMHG